MKKLLSSKGFAPAGALCGYLTKSHVKDDGNQVQMVGEVIYAEGLLACVRPYEIDQWKMTDRQSLSVRTRSEVMGRKHSQKHRHVLGSVR